MSGKDREKQLEVVKLIQEARERDKFQRGAIDFQNLWKKHLEHGGVRIVRGSRRDYTPNDVEKAIVFARSKIPSISSAKQILDSSLNITLDNVGSNLERTLNPLDALVAATRSIAGCRRCNL